MPENYQNQLEGNSASAQKIDVQSDDESVEDHIAGDSFNFMINFGFRAITNGCSLYVHNV